MGEPHISDTPVQMYLNWKIINGSYFLNRLTQIKENLFYICDNIVFNPEIWQKQCTQYIL